MNFKITSGVNAGIACNIGGHRILCDVFHDEKIPGLSSVTSDRLTKLLSDESFADPELVFYTHCHPDHYSYEMTNAVLKRYPGCYQALPEKKNDVQLLIRGAYQKLRISDITLEFIKLTHEGKQYKQVPHYGCIISCSNKAMLIVGDCEMASDELACVLDGKKIYAVIMPFPWITLPTGRKFIEKYINPEHLIINHLPFDEDDIYGYRKATFDSVDKINVPKLTIFTDILQYTEI